MPRQPLFAGLVVDENDRPVEVSYVGDEPCYVVDDAGFHRHIPSEQVDRQVLKMMSEMIEGNEDLLADQAAKMLGQGMMGLRIRINVHGEVTELHQPGTTEPGDDMGEE
jgi:hypothetical protein